MSSLLSILLISMCYVSTCSSAQKSCRGHCGEAYFRGSECQCDYECLTQKDCCKNYESVCTSKKSCKGRCGENFKRGRQCHCDVECIKYNQCCPDYELQCNNEGTVGSPLPHKGPEKPQNNFKYELYSPNSSATESELISPNSSAHIFSPASTRLAVNQQPTELYPTITSPTDIMPSSEQTDPNVEITTPVTTEPNANDHHEITVSEQTAENFHSVFELKKLSHNASSPTISQESALNSIPTSDQSATIRFQRTPEPKHTYSAKFQASIQNLKPSNHVQSEYRFEDRQDLENLTKIKLEPSENTTLGYFHIKNMVSTDKPTTAEIIEASEHQNQNKKDILFAKASTTYPASVTISPSLTKAPNNPTKPNDANNFQKCLDYQTDVNNDTNLCSGLPVNGLTVLRNGTIVAFRGHYFWILDSKRNPGPARLITDTWGIPSPIDTVFTRCNCQSKTYIFRGDKYWRFANDIVDAGFPRPISEGFGLGGHIVAALSMPQYKRRRESVLIFKRGGLAQKYTYRNTPDCGKSATATERFTKEAVSVLGKQIVISKTWVGFPSTVNSAVSVQTTGGDGYEYYVFSPTMYYKLKMKGDTPVILSPRDGRESQNSAKSWFRCPA